jgi:hypothetical protein
MLAVFARVKPRLRKSITFDNDTAFATWTSIPGQRAELKTPTVDYGAGCLISSASTKCATGNPGSRHHRQCDAQKNALAYLFSTTLKGKDVQFRFA